MKRMRLVLWMTMLTLSLALALPVSAQDDTCDPSIFGEIDDLLTQMEETLNNGDISTADEILSNIRATIAPCIGDAVTSNADRTPVIQEFDGVEMVLVPAGCFDMGSNDGGSDEQPIHEQCFDEPFWIDRYEVTNAQYGSIGCEDWSSEPDQPRNCVTWFEARDFCEQRGMRLPTEVEWEYAARGPDGLIFPWGNTYNAAYVIGEDDPTYGDTRTAPVGSREGGISWVGAYDLSGNVWEWTSTIYQDYPYSVTDGRESNSNSFRVLRGGSFDITGAFLRSASRGRYDPDYGLINYGFRCARSY